MSFMDEIRKIPPVTRFLCGSSLAVSVPVMLQLVSPYKVIFVKELVTQRLEVWRVFTSFFLGGSGLNYLFDFIMLYRNSDQLESSVTYQARSSDYAWQLLVAAAAILTLNIPLRTFVHARPLLVCLTYLSSRLAPPGSRTSLFGLITMPVIYFPYALIALDLIMAGPQAAATSVTGAVVGHLWWWLVHDTRTLREWASAPTWMRNMIDGPGRPGGSATGGSGGVHVIPPRRREEPASTSGGHSWGSGRRLGD